ncbi:hypothetical protein [Streptomyces africanus]|uniref:hypothetical protein n=1 Tax=Streptomyces africanus TaxID=231024 RepID=UPI000A3974FC|nr:hypothetical protein [Streptomyces africanus]
MLAVLAVRGTMLTLLAGGELGRPPVLEPLRREFEATQTGTHTWDQLASRPETWRVRIGKAAADA